MEILKTIFPLSFGLKDDNNAFIKFLIEVVIAAIVCAVLGKIFSLIPIVRILTNIIFGLVGLYIFVSLIIGVLVYVGVIEDK